MWRFKPSNGRLAVGFFVGVAGGAAWKYNEVRSPSATGLSTTTFAPFAITKKEPVSSTSSIFTLNEGLLSQTNLQELFRKGVWSIQIKQPQLQIARAYTPLPPTPTSNADELRLLIRRERNGEVSNYLHRLAIGQSAELRGPTVEYEVPKDTTEVLFLAGGTGIAPAMQLAYGLQGKASMSVMWANRTREDCTGGKSDNPVHESGGGWLSGLSRLVQGSPSIELVKTVDDATSVPKNAVVRQLEQLKQTHGGIAGTRLQVDYFVDEEGS